MHFGIFEFHEAVTKKDLNIKVERLSIITASVIISEWLGALYEKGLLDVSCGILSVIVGS